MQINSSQLALLKLHASLFLNFQSKNFAAIEIFHYLIGKEYEITLQFGSISSKVNEIFTKYPKNTQQLSYLDLLNNFNNSNSFSIIKIVKDNKSLNLNLVIHDFLNQYLGKDIILLEKIIFGINTDSVLTTKLNNIGITAFQQKEKSIFYIFNYKLETKNSYLNINLLNDIHLDNIILKKDKILLDKENNYNNVVDNIIYYKNKSKKNLYNFVHQNEQKLFCIQLFAAILCDKDEPFLENLMQSNKNLLSSQSIYLLFKNHSHLPIFSFAFQQYKNITSEFKKINLDIKEENLYSKKIPIDLTAIEQKHSIPAQAIQISLTKCFSFLKNLDSFCNSHIMQEKNAFDTKITFILTSANTADLENGKDFFQHILNDKNILKNKTLTSDELASIFHYHSLKKDILSIETNPQNHNKKMKI